MDDLKEKIIEALALMDVFDDNQWTADGAPKVDTVVELADVEKLTRADIINAAPQFSRENPDVTAAAASEDKSEVVAENSLGWLHPEIVEAQEAYDEIVRAKAEVSAEEKKRGEKLSEVTNRLMLQRVDKQANQREIMRTIQASNASREARVTNFNANRALLTGRPPASPIDAAQAGSKKVRPKM